MKLKEQKESEVIVESGESIMFLDNEKATEFFDKFKNYEFRDFSHLSDEIAYFNGEYFRVTEHNFYRLKQELNGNLDHFAKRSNLEFLCKYERIEIYKEIYAIKKQLELLKKLK